VLDQGDITQELQDQTARVGGRGIAYKTWLTWCHYRTPVLTCASAILLFCTGRFVGAVQKDEEIVRLKSIVADRYEVRGINGKQAALFYLNPDGKPTLALFDENEKVRLDLRLARSGSPGITLFGDDVRSRIAIRLSDLDGAPSLSLFDASGNEAVNLGILKDFGPQINVGTPGKGRISIGLSRTGEPRVELWSTVSEPRIVLNVVNDRPVISLLEKDHVARTIWKLLPDGSPAFFLLDGLSRERAIIATDKDGKPSIKFIGPDKKESRTIE
jgi:hypothetical protein